MQGKVVSGGSSASSGSSSSSFSSSGGASASADAGSQVSSPIALFRRHWLLCSLVRDDTQGAHNNQCLLSFSIFPHVRLQVSAFSGPDEDSPSSSSSSSSSPSSSSSSSSSAGGSDSKKSGGSCEDKDPGNSQSCQANKDAGNCDQWWLKAGMHLPTRCCRKWTIVHAALRTRLAYFE